MEEQPGMTMMGLWKRPVENSTPSSVILSPTRREQRISVRAAAAPSGILAASRPNAPIAGPPCRSIRRKPKQGATRFAGGNHEVPAGLARVTGSLQWRTLDARPVRGPEGTG